MLISTFKSQVQTQKMQSIQPELNALSNKLKDPNLSQAEKSRLSMKMMEIYQKNGINPMATLLPTLISMPIFLSVWSAVSQTLVIRTGTFLGLNLGESVSTQVFSLNIASIVLFVLMTASQIVSMKLPNIIRKKQANYKNKEQVEEVDESKKTNIYDDFEREFGRTLSPIEYELISGWLDNEFTEEIILCALKEAVFNGVSNLRYIDKILYEWGKAGIKNISDVEEMRKKRNQKIKKDQSEEIDTDIFDWNWFDDDGE